EARVLARDEDLALGDGELTLDVDDQVLAGERPGVAGPLQLDAVAIAEIVAEGLEAGARRLLVQTVGVLEVHRREKIAADGRGGAGCRRNQTLSSRCLSRLARQSPRARARARALARARGPRPRFPAPARRWRRDRSARGRRRCRRR